jgi:hypothetical protein
MELTTALSLVVITVASLTSYCLIRWPERARRRVHQAERRLNWRQGKAPLEPVNHFRIHYHA